MGGGEYAARWLSPKTARQAAGCMPLSCRPTWRRYSAMSPPPSCRRFAAPPAPRSFATLNHRARALVLHHLTSAAVRRLARSLRSSGRLGDPQPRGRAGRRRSRSTPLVLQRIPSGRAESLTPLPPQAGGGDRRRRADGERTAAPIGGCRGLLECDYLPRLDLPFDPASTSRRARVEDALPGWIATPAAADVSRAVALRSARVYGCQSLWHEVSRGDRRGGGPRLPAGSRERLPGQPAPADVFPGCRRRRIGRADAAFRLERNALCRWSTSAGCSAAAETRSGAPRIERFATARALLPEHDAIFREAADTLSIVLWQQGRIGISQGTDGAELPPALLSRHDRQVLKSGFRCSFGCSSSRPTRHG